MVVATGLLTFRLYDVNSLKEKRKIVKSLVAKMNNQFNASVAEVGSNDHYHKSEIGFSMVGNDVGLMNSKMDKLINYAEDLGLAEIVDTDTEIIRF